MRIREDFLEIVEDMITYIEGTLNSEQDEYMHTYTHIKNYIKSKIKL